MRNSLYLLLLLLFSYGANASITDSIIMASPSGCCPIYISAGAYENSTSSIVLRKWTIETSTGTVIYTVPTGLNPNLYRSIPCNGSCYSAYYVRLVSFNADGDSAVALSPIISAYKAPELQASLQSNGCLNYDVTVTLNYTDSCNVLDSVGVRWGDGTSSFTTGGHVFTHHYPTVSQCYDVQILGYNNIGCVSDTIINNVCLGAARVTANVSPNTFPCLPTINSFFCIIDGMVDSLRWIYGDGGYSNIAQSSHFYAYTNGPCYTVKLVTWGCGVSDTTVVDTLCPSGPYVSSYTISDSTLCVCKDSLHIAINTVGASALTFLYGCNVAFERDTFNAIGTPQQPSVSQFKYAICLRDICQPQVFIEDSTGCLIGYNFPFLYVDSPEVHFNYSVSNNTVQFNNQTLPGSGGFTNAKWTFGTGDSSSAFSPSYHYPVSGSYFVCLTVSNSTGCTSTYCDSISTFFTGIHSLLEDETSFHIYPNPATNLLFVSAHGTAIKSVSLYTLDGKLLKEVKQVTDNGIDISGFSKGVYIAEMKTKDLSVKRRWTKM